MTTSPVVTITEELVAELEAAANAFPDYDLDSNETPFFNGPSGESLGGEPTGLYCVYGQAFEIDGETYDGPTLVAACPYTQAKFICDAKPAIKLLSSEVRALLAERAELKRDAERYRHASKRESDGDVDICICKVDWNSSGSAGYAILTGDNAHTAIDAAMQAAK